VTVAVLTAAAPAWSGSGSGLLTATVRINEPVTVSLPQGTSITIEATDATAVPDQPLAVRVKAAAGQSVTIDFDGGQNFSGSRRLRGSTSYLDYSLYSDAAMTTPWSPQIVLGQGGNVEIAVPIYLKVLAQSGTAPGLYTDTLTVSVSY
jgi:spore coat protein U-like protein